MQILMTKSMEEAYNALLFVQYKCTNNWPFGFYKFMISLKNESGTEIN